MKPSVSQAFLFLAVITLGSANSAWAASNHTAVAPVSSSASISAVQSAIDAPAPLLTPVQLEALRTSGGIRIVDIRSSKEYAANHIPGAVSAPYGKWRGPASSPGQLPALDDLALLVRGLGLDAGSYAVVVSSGADATDFGGAARVYWTLKYLGLNRLSILNGGLKAWVGAGLPQDTLVPTVTETEYTPTPRLDIIATQPDVEAQLDNPRTRLLDARPALFFEGETKAPTAKIPGTIHNAVNLEFSKWFVPGTAIFVSPEKAREIAAGALNTPADETISFCNTGHWAATDWFALSEVVGEKNVRLYPASLAEWTQSPEALPMDNVPSRSHQILNSLKSLIGKS